MKRDPNPRHRRRLWRVIVTIVVLTLFPRWLERTLLFPGQYRSAPVLNLPPGGQVLQSPSEGPEMVFLLGRGVSVQHPGPVVVFAHGNGELIDDWFGGLETYRAAGVSVALIEYDGFGRAPGTPSERGIVQGTLSAIERLVEDPRVDGSKLVFHGRSLGGGIVGGLIRERTPAALILESSFMSVPEVVPRVPSILIIDKFDTRAALEAYRGPLLVMHGNRDRVVPFAHGQALNAVDRPGASPTVFLQFDSGHNDLPRNERYWDSVFELLRNAGVL